LVVTKAGIFAFLKEIFLFCYCLLCQKSTFGKACKNLLKVFLPSMQLAALSCRDLVRKGIKELMLTPIHGKKGGEKL